MELDPWPRRTRLLAVFGTLAFLAYGYKLFDRTLTIDQEFHFFSNLHREWISQGRFGMGLLARWLPPVACLPFLPTFLFIVGIVSFSIVAAERLFSKPWSQAIFGAIFIGWPYWTHLVEFSSVSYGIGIALVVLGLAIRELPSNAASPWKTFFILLTATAFSFSIYEALFVLVLNFTILDLSQNAFSDGEPWRAETLLKKTAVSLAGLAAGYALYKVGAGIAQWAVDIPPSAYSASYLKVGAVLHDPKLFLAVLREVWNQSSGGDQIFLGYGWAFTTLPAIGLVARLVSLLRSRSRYALKFGLTLAALASLCLFPLLSANGIPPRGLTGDALLFAFFGAVGADLLASMSVNLRSRLALATLVWIFFFSSWLSTTLFHSDYLVRTKDSNFAGLILKDILTWIPDTTVPTPVVFIGTKSFRVEGYHHRKQIFGISYFEHDGGSSVRIEAFLRILGYDFLTPEAPPSSHRAEIAAMPSWPKQGYINKLGGVLVVKLSNP